MGDNSPRSNALKIPILYLQCWLQKLPVLKRLRNDVIIGQIGYFRGELASGTTGENDWAASSIMKE